MRAGPGDVFVLLSSFASATHFTIFSEQIAGEFVLLTFQEPACLRPINPDLDASGSVRIEEAGLILGRLFILHVLGLHIRLREDEYCGAGASEKPATAFERNCGSERLLFAWWMGKQAEL